MLLHALSSNALLQIANVLSFSIICRHETDRGRVGENLKGWHMKQPASLAFTVSRRGRARTRLSYRTSSQTPGASAQSKLRLADGMHWGNSRPHRRWVVGVFSSGFSGEVFRIFRFILGLTVYLFPLRGSVTEWVYTVRRIFAWALRGIESDVIINFFKDVFLMYSTVFGEMLWNIMTAIMKIKN